MMGSLFNAIGNTAMGMFNFIIRLLLLFGIPYLIIIFAFAVYYIVFKKMRPKKRTAVKRSINDNLLYKLLVMLPRRLVLDFIQADPDVFRMHGLHLFCGRQGSGKTITMCYMLMKLKRRYPLLKIRTNFCFSGEDDSIKDWTQVIDNTNGVHGQIEAMDELQNWFSSNDSKNFPPEMLGEITQQRKQRKVLFGTSQVFTRVSKPIREQVALLYEPITLFNALTIVRVTEPTCDDDGTVKSKKAKKIFCFVHTDELRECYDTYKKIERYKQVGFKEKPVIDIDIKTAG